MSNVVEILVKGKDESGAKTLDKQATGARNVGKETKKAAGGLGIFKMAAAGVAGVGLVNFFKSANSEARDSQKVNAQTAAVLKSTGGAAKITAAQVGALATAISNKTGIDDEQIQSSENMLLTFTNVRNEVGKGNDVFSQATQIVTDMSAALGQDSKNSAIQLGKALNDPIKGITALSRVGVTFTQQQKDQIATMVKSGNTLGAQKVILAELTKEFGGSAKAQATAGAKASVAWGNFKEAVGTALIPVLDSLANWFVGKGIPMLQNMLTYVQKNAGTWKQDLTPAWNTAVSVGKTLAGVVKDILDFLRDHPAVAKAAALGVGGLGVAYKLANGPLGTFIKLLGSFGRGGGAAAGSGGQLSGVLGKIGIAAAAAAGGYMLLDHAFNSNAEHASLSKDVMQNLTEAFGKSKGAIDANVSAAQRYNLESTGIAKKAANAGITLDQLTTALVGPRQGFDNLISVWKRMGNPSAQTLDAFRSLRAQMALAQDKTYETAKAFYAAGSATMTAAQRASAWRDVLSKVPKRTDIYVTAHDNASTIASRVKKAIDMLRNKEIDITTYVQNVIMPSVTGQTRRKSGRGDAAGGVFHDRHYASGGATSDPGYGTTITDEYGPEIKRLPNGTMIYPAGQSAQMAKQWGGGGGPIVLEIKSSGSRLDDLLVELLRKAVRVRGGDVQLVLGRG